jgi:hypothetical protein
MGGCVKRVLWIVIASVGAAWCGYVLGHDLLADALGARKDSP